jgi:hypothetical protein
MGKLSLIGAWVLVALLATTLTWQIVSAADEQVSDRPVAPLQVGAPLVTASDSTTTTAEGTTSGPSTPVSQAGSSSTTVTTDDGTSTATAATTPSTTAAWKSKAISTGGGVVVVAYREGEVALGSATPAAGFATHVNKSGPSEVEVEFESESTKFEVKARWSDGELRVESDSESEED